jgi:hypothetical protein
LSLHLRVINPLISKKDDLSKEKLENEYLLTIEVIFEDFIKIKEENYPNLVII